MVTISLPQPTPPGRRDLLAALAAKAESQDGAISRDQLEVIGFDENAIAYLIRCKLIHRVHRCVYAVGQPVLTPRGRRFGAVLAGGEGALLSHIAAGVNYRVLRSDRARFDVTVPRDRTSTKQIQFHTSRTLAELRRAAIHLAGRRLRARPSRRRARRLVRDRPGQAT